MPFPLWGVLSKIGFFVVVYFWFYTGWLVTILLDAKVTLFLKIFAPVKGTGVIFD